jgi:hypothetical protein
MADTGVPKGKSVPKVTKNVDAQHGPSKANSDNELTSNSRVIKAATSNLMKGVSQSRGPGGAK